MSEKWALPPGAQERPFCAILSGECPLIFVAHAYDFTQHIKKNKSVHKLESYGNLKVRLDTL